MKIFLPFITCILLFYGTDGYTQVQRRPFERPAQIKKCRQQLKSSFLNNEPTAVSLWMDSLARLEDDSYVGLVWDERWLLYYWMETYGNLTDEAARFDQETRQSQLYKIQPPADSLFEIIDSALYDRRYELFTAIGRAFLNEEERAFATLQLEYLLRLDPDKEVWRDRLDAFLNRYPKSRFNTYLKSLRPPKVVLSSRHHGGHLLLLNNQWSGGLARVMRTGFGFDLAYEFGKKRLNCLAHVGILWQRTAAGIYEKDGSLWFELPKNDPMTQVGVGFEAGYDVLHTDRFRLWPAAGAGFNWLGPTPPDSEEEPLPEYYDLFNYLSFSPAVAVNTDIKLKKTQETGKGGYSGIRCRLGYQWLAFNKKNPALSGNMFFFAVGWTLYRRATISK
jgi:hypothetical protein